MCDYLQQHSARRVRFLLLSAVVVLPGCGTAAFRETRVLAIAHQTDSPLRVRTANGGIMVKQAPGDVTISAELKALTAERLADAEVIATREADGTLAVSVDWPDGRMSNEGCDFMITLPDANGVELDTSNGRVAIGGLSGHAELQSSNGDVTVDGHAGPVNVTTSNGAVRLSRVTGDATVHTSNGDIDIDEAGGASKTRTSNGSVEVRLADTSHGPLSVRSANGSVQLELGPAFAGELSLQTSNGRLNVDHLQSAKLVTMGDDSVRLLFGEAGGEGSTVITSNGSITVRDR